MSKTKSETKTPRERLNLSVKSEMLQWYKDQAESKGLTLSALVQIALNDYRETQTIYKAVDNFPEIIKQLQQLQKIGGLKK